ncbi:MAG: hypothetical protein J5486_00830 [Bacteroidaceae bacterium]|nr:hypothetical protein [Bacteroidaceae bacterium]
MRQSRTISSSILTYFGIVLTSLALSSCNLFGDDNRTPVPTYMAVQIEDGDGWSIIDENGDVVADEEYDEDDQVSRIYGETYFVKSEGTYQLYSIDNPKKPIVDEEYTGATLMFKDRALVTKAGEPIQIINAQGEVIATLSKDIVGAQRAGYHTFYFVKADGKAGWMDRNGDIIQEGFTQLYMGNGTIVAVGKKTENGKWLIYNNKGDKTGEFKGSYSCREINDGYISVKDDDKPLLLNHEGDVVLKMKKATYIAPPYYQSEPRCIFWDKNSYNEGLANLDGEVLIRAKYNRLIAIDDNRFMAKKGDDWGVIDSNDEKIISFKYSQMTLLGSNYLCQTSSDSWCLIDSKGERVDKESYNSISDFTCDNAVYYVNVESQAKTISDAVKGFSKGESVSKIGQRLNLSASDDYRWSSSLSKEESAPLVNITTSYHFDSYIVTELTHQVTHNDGWWSYNETVHDGWAWSNATLDYIVISLEYSQTNAETAQESLIEALKGLGFKEGSDDDILVKDGKQVTLSNYGSHVTATITKNN